MKPLMNGPNIHDEPNAPRMRVLATFTVNVGKWLNLYHDAMPFDHQSLHFAELVFNPHDFPHPLYGKLLLEASHMDASTLEMSSRTGDGWMPHKGGVRAAYWTNPSRGKPLTVLTGSEIDVPSDQPSLYESAWFVLPNVDQPILFWLQAKCAAVALFTLQLGVYDEA